MDSGRACWDLLRYSVARHPAGNSNEPRALVSILDSRRCLVTTATTIKVMAACPASVLAYVDGSPKLPVQPDNLEDYPYQGRKQSEWVFTCPKCSKVFNPSSEAKRPSYDRLAGHFRSTSITGCGSQYQLWIYINTRKRSAEKTAAINAAGAERRKKVRPAKDAAGGASATKPPCLQA